MSLDSFVYRLYCITEGQYVTTVSDVAPTTCPNNPAHIIDPTTVTIISVNFVDISSNSYINIESTLPDNEAIKIVTGVTGGIVVNSGFGGIMVNTTNSIQMNSQAASNLTTTLGNLTLNSTTGLMDIDGGAGINIGNSGTTGSIFIGTTGSDHIIRIGILNGGTSVNIDAGTGGFNVNTTGGGAISLNADGIASNFTLANPSANQDLTIATVGVTSSRIVLSAQGTGPDSIIFETSNGGLEASIVGDINLVSSNNTGSAITLNTYPNGGITISSGSEGVAMNCPSFSLMAIGTFNASEYIIVGNNGGSSYLGLRAGTSGIIKTQQAFTALSDADATLTIAQLLTNIFTITPSVVRTLTLDTASNVVSGVYGAQVGDSFDFTIINLAGATGVTVVAGTNGTLYGSGSVNGTGFGTGSSLFRVRLTNVTGGSQTYDLYRIS